MTGQHGYEFCVDELSQREQDDFWALYRHAYDYATTQGCLSQDTGDRYAIEYAAHNYDDPEYAPAHTSESQSNYLRRLYKEEQAPEETPQHTECNSPNSPAK